MREFRYAQTTRFLLSISDEQAVKDASAACRREHGRARDNLPPRVAVDAPELTDARGSEDVEVMDDPILGAVWHLLECGRHDVLGSSLPGVATRVANHDGQLGPWPPWPPAEAL